ncbi:DgyrCDS8842 [Dimorphilus gyrociliatus]|uniref:Cytochrome b-c1 complex subunit 8 n=1 Tax=Dimorphilus gyrociliatus TaxID=2664684 RepID=A0A7I8VVH4_9ANNE|nr:DgyrCDS8842 [Dimorphilus gyrociliatus]
MGKGFGELVKVRGIVMYTISPFEQKTFGGILSKGIPNFFKRTYSQVFRVVPPFVAAYLIYDWGEKEHTRLGRKDPKEFAHFYEKKDE